MIGLLFILLRKHWEVLLFAGAVVAITGAFNIWLGARDAKLIQEYERKLQVQVHAAVRHEQDRQEAATKRALSDYQERLTSAKREQAEKVAMLNREITENEKRLDAAMRRCNLDDSDLDVILQRRPH